MSDSSARQARQVVRELGARLAAAGALMVALVSLLQHAPLWLASLRGAGTLTILVLGTRLGAAALGRAVDSDLLPKESKKVRAEKEP